MLLSYAKKNPRILQRNLKTVIIHDALKNIVHFHCIVNWDVNRYLITGQRD